MKRPGESAAVVVRSITELTSVHRNPIGPGRTRVVLEIAQIPPTQSQVWQERLNSLFKECGCAAGGFTALLGLLGAIAWQFLESDWRLSSWPGLLLRAFLLTLGGGFAGKVIGIEWARWQIRTLTAEMRRLTAVTGSPPDPNHGDV